VIWVFVLVPPVLVVTGAVIWANFLTPRGEHAAFADPADRTDPYGDNWPPPEPGEPDDGFWEQHAPLPARVEVITGPGTRIRQTSEVTASVLAKGTGQLTMLPPDPPAPPPDETGEIPAYKSVYGIPPDNQKLVDDLFAPAEKALAKHATPPEMIP
jgi:hypothetical protein